MALVFTLFMIAPSFAEDSIAAKVNGVAIMSSELEHTVDKMLSRITFHGDASGSKRAEVREKALQDLIDWELQYQDAVANGLKADKNRVKKQFQQIKDGYKSNTIYQQALKNAGKTEEQHMALFERNVLVWTAIEKKTIEPARMDDAAVRAYYDTNAGKFREPESAQLRIISTKDEKKALDVLAKLKQGEDFSALAARMSEDDFGVKGGDIGIVRRGMILPELEDAAFKMQPEETSGLIQADGKWFIIKVEKKEPGRQRMFEESKDALRKVLEEQRSNELEKKWMDDLRSKAKIEIMLKAEDREQAKNKGQKPDADKIQ